MPTFIQSVKEVLVGRHRFRFGNNFTVNKIKDDLKVGSAYEIEYNPPATTSNDFWRSGAGATSLADGSIDLTENIRRNGSVGINTDPLATHHVNGTSIIGGTGNIQASKLHVQQGSGNIGLPTALFDLNNCGTPCGQVVGSNVMLRNNNSTSPDNGGAITWANATTTVIGAGIRGWNRTGSGMGLSFMTNGENARMTINGIGHVGINTSSQHSFLDSRGSFSTIVTFSNDNTALPLTVNHHRIELGGSVTTKNIQLPNANTCSGREYMVYFTGDSPLTASATITAPTAQIGDPSLSVGMLSSFSISRGGLRSVSLVSDGTNWHVFNRDIASNETYGGNVATITANYTVGITDGTVLLNNGATAITVTLPSATLFPRRKVTISRMAGSSGAVTVTSAGGNVQSLTVGTMGASTTLGTIGTYTGRATFQSSGTAWHFVG